MFISSWDLFDSDEILRTSIGEVTKDIGARFISEESEGTLCDLRMGPRHKQELCLTCKQNHEECRGHFMHISLAVPLITDELLSIVYKLLLKENKHISLDRTLNEFFLSGETAIHFLLQAIIYLWTLELFLTSLLAT